MAIGLIVNALVTNSLKYSSIGGDTNVLGLSLVFQADGVERKIWDVGPGIDQNAWIDSGLGQILEQAFVLHVGGKLSTTNGLDGTGHILTLRMAYAPANVYMNNEKIACIITISWAYPVFSSCIAEFLIRDSF